MKHNPEMAAALEAIDKLWEKAGEVNRIGLVIYQSYQATQREAAMCATSETRFGNHGTLGSSMARSLSYEEHGKHILGTSLDAATRLNWENLLGVFNSMYANGVSFVGNTFDSMMKKIEHTSADGTKHRLPPFPHNPLDPKQSRDIKNKRQMYCWYWNLAHKMLLGVRKSAYKAVRDRIDAQNALTAPRALQLSERRAMKRTPIGPITPVKYTVTVRDVLGHRFSKATRSTHWQVELLGATTPIWVDEKQAPW